MSIKKIKKTINMKPQYDLQNQSQEIQSFILKKTKSMRKLHKPGFCSMIHIIQIRLTECLMKSAKT